MTDARIFRDWSATREIASAWDGLARQYGDAGVFLEHGWFEQWWRAFGGDKELFVVALFREAALVAVFPCCVARSGSGRSGLISMTSEAPYDFLVDRAHRSEALNQFAAVLEASDVFPATFEDFTASSENRVLLDEALRKRKIPVSRYSQSYAPYVDARGTSWDGYTATLHSKLRNNLRKGRRRAEKAGPLSFEVIERTPSLDLLMTEILDVESHGWKGVNRSAMLADPRKELFYRSMAQWAMDKGYLHLCVLRFNGRIVAFDLCVAAGRTVFALKTGYHEELARGFSAGNVMRFEVLRHVFESPRFDRYDFLGRCFEWKLEWTSTAGVWTSYEVYEPSIRGRLTYLGRHGWKAPLKASPALIGLARRWREARLKAQGSRPNIQRPRRLEP